MEQLFNVGKLYAAITLEGMHYANVPRGWSYPSHRHHTMEFIYCVNGCMKQWVNGQPFLIGERDCLVVKPNLAHHTEALSEDASFFVFHFDVDIAEIRSVFQMAEPPFIAANQGEGRLSIGGWVNDFMAEFGGLLRDKGGKSGSGNKEKLMHSVHLLRMQMRVMELICLLAQHFIRETNFGTGGAISPAQFQLASEAAHQLELHAGKRLNIQEVADALGVHRSRLSGCFKQVYGISPREYLSRIKIRSAKQLLQNTTLTIEEIAGQLEFSSPAHFSTFFQNQVGMSPQKYRNLRH